MVDVFLITFVWNGFNVCMRRKFLSTPNAQWRQSFNVFFPDLMGLKEKKQTESFYGGK